MSIILQSCILEIRGGKATMNEIKTAALIGMGAIGGVIAPGLADVLENDAFRIIAGGIRKERIEQGITINGKQYHFSVLSPEQPSKPVDLAIFAVKNHQLEQAISDMENQVGPDTIILSLLNGVESEQRIGEVYGFQNMLYSIIRIPAMNCGGTISYPKGVGQIDFGEKDGTVSEKTTAVKALFDRAGIRSKVNKDMMHMMWYKFMANVGENQTAAVLGVPYRGFQVNAHVNAIRKMAAREVMSIANAEGIRLTEEDLKRQDAYMSNIIPTGRPSTLQDIEAGRKTEVDSFAGTVIRLGKKHNIPTPCNEMLFHMIKALEEKQELCI